MMVLSLDSATPAASVALINRDRVVASCYFDLGNPHSQCLLVEADHLLKAAECSWDELEAVATTTGPGSFTGLRIGLSAAKGICLARRLPLIGVSTLEALAGRLPFSRIPVCSMLDARRGQVYSAVYETATGFPDMLSGPRAVEPEALVEELSDVVLTGSGSEAYRQVFADLPGVRFAPVHLNTPDAATVGWLGIAKLACGDFLDVATAEPDYLRFPAIGPPRRG